ncbi:GMC family oxidoreductase [Altericroceibacterium endophyticum]|uniref:Glucose-methanol-choline oxidoreductase n=1 Tax=Altericroceibacterium endophyticum TaxID=1808508 RepID=A0A6I4T8K0_9SPHN|nr:GMC family oxidoreductase N-terminal domain-containing protein [Altericroceibacterium endophyticum]MXO66819.1 glucose-methanol-choline oxidoreductase [Altericroceibacterium endophyticum]
MADQQPDIIVIGGGSAGAACAGRLADAGVNVLLVEAGKSDKDIRSRVPALMANIVQTPDFDWCYRAEPDASVGGRPDVWPAGKRLGGGSAINGMMFVRGHKWDYDHWAELGATGWDYASVLPYFRRMEDNERGEDEWRGTGGPIAVSEVRARYEITGEWVAAVEEAGYPRSPDLNGELAEGVDYIQLSQRSGMRWSAARGYLEKKRPNLQIMLETQVQRIIVEHGRATGIAIVKDGQECIITARAGVVLSAGALNTPRLLMLSGIGPAEEMKAHGIDPVIDLPGVGQNLQEHPGTHLVNTVDAHTLNDDSRGLAGLKQLLSLAVKRSGALTTGIGHAQAFVRSREDLPAPNLQLAFSAFAFDVTDKGNLALSKKSSVSTFIALMRPSSRGTVTLRSNDPHDAPKISHLLLGDEDDVLQLVEGIQIARKIMGQDAIASTVLSEVRPGENLASNEALSHYVRAATIPMYHPVGTAKMGAKADPMAVVDSECRLYGVDGLWVADASIMPSLPAGNTNATSIMIGDKASDHVLAQIRNDKKVAA